MRGAACALLLAGLAACAPAPRAARLTVFAAASLDEALGEALRAWSAAGTGLDVDLHLAGTATLVAQIEQGAPADVIASADEESLRRLAEGGHLDGAAVPFARNRLALAVQPGNPRGLRSLADLARDDLRTGLCAVDVPAGRTARAALARAGVEARPATLEPSVRALTAKLELGELDAAIVYATDVRARAPRLEEIAVAALADATTLYPAAVVRGSRRRDAAHAFVAWLASRDAAAVLARHGFAPP